MAKSFYLTTAIDYLNGQPHLGHAYEKIITDVLARGQRSLGERVFFLTGLDEHGQKVQQAAMAEGKTPQDYCDGLASEWNVLPAALNLRIEDFVRTTEPRHKRVVQAALTKLEREGHFYKAEHTGFYSTRQETFLTEKDRLPDGSFDPFYGEVIKLKESNYYFKLSPHQDWLIAHIEQNPGFVAPDHRRNEVLGFLKNNRLEDLCITRPKSRLSWGIPVPFDLDYVTYVWFDALLNYISVPADYGDPVVCAALALPSAREDVEAKELWPANMHVIGKDILQFHAVYWPIMLKAMGLPLPARILAHGWWQKDGERMSKSTGNTVDPIAVVAEWGIDAFRYYVVRELAVGADGNWTDAGFAARYHAELANGLGNLVNRSLSMLHRYRGGVLSRRSDGLSAETAVAAADTVSLLRECQPQAALQAIWTLITRANQYVDQTAPFKLAKDPTQADKLDEVLYTLAEVCRVLAILLWPFIPGTAEKIFAQLGIEAIPDEFARSSWGGLREGHKIGPIAPLFPRRDQPKG